MAYRSDKNIGSRKFSNLSGSGTLQVAGNTTIGGALNVTGAVTLVAPASGSLAGSGSQLALDASGIVVLDFPNTRRRTPIGTYFSSSDTGDNCTTISLMPSLGSIDGRATIPITNGSAMINIDITSTITADIEAAATGASGLDTGVVDPDNSKGYYLFLITKDAGADPALIFSLNPISPEMPPITDSSAAYTYRSEALFYAYRNATWDTWQRFAQGKDGWTYSRHTLLSAGTATSETGVDCRDTLPSGGEAMIWIRAENTDDVNKNITLSYQGGVVTGSSFISHVMGSIRKNADCDGRISAWLTMYLAVPVLGSVNDEDTFYYEWSLTPVGDGANAAALAYRTSAYCR